MVPRPGGPRTAGAPGDGEPDPGKPRLRHPIHPGLLLELAGIVQVKPAPMVVLAGVIGGGWVFLRAPLEEVDLLQRMPEYHGCMTHVPAFVPRVRRKTAAV